MQPVFINSMPKSGTHLLIKAIQLLGYREHFAEVLSPDRPANAIPLFLNFREVRQALEHEQLDPEEGPGIPVGTLSPVNVPVSVLRRWMAGIGGGQFILGHIMADERLATLLRELGMRQVIILRDPRAVLVSLVHFIADNRQMPHAHFLREDFRSLERNEQLRRLLEGGFHPKAGVTTLPFADSYRRMLSWSSLSGTLIVRYEDLVGPSGGGTARRQLDAFAQIAEAIGISGRVTSLLAAQLYDTSTRTFRLGTIDRWRAELDSEGLALVQRHCGELLDAAGYGD